MPCTVSCSRASGGGAVPAGIQHHGVFGLPSCGIFGWGLPDGYQRGCGPQRRRAHGIAPGAEPPPLGWPSHTLIVALEEFLRITLGIENLFGTPSNCSQVDSMYNMYCTTWQAHRAHHSGHTAVWGFALARPQHSQAYQKHPQQIHWRHPPPLQQWSTSTTTCSINCSSSYSHY